LALHASLSVYFVSFGLGVNALASCAVPQSTNAAPDQKIQVVSKTKAKTKTHCSAHTSTYQENFRSQRNIRENPTLMPSSSLLVRKE